MRTRFLELQELVSVLPEVFNAFHVLSDEERKAEYDTAFFSKRAKTGGKFVGVLQTAGKLLAMGAEPASCPKVGKLLTIGVHFSLTLLVLLVKLRRALLGVNLWKR